MFDILFTKIINITINMFYIQAFKSMDINLIIGLFSCVEIHG